MKLYFFIVFLFLLNLTEAQVTTIKGKISNLTGSPIENAAISTLNNNQSTISDSMGNFSIKTDAKNLIVSKNGFISDTITIINTKTYYHISLFSEFAEMGSIIVTTHAGDKKAILQNPIAISHVSPKQIDKIVSANLIDALVKSTPGLNAVQTGPNVSKPFIRGLGYNRVLTLLDGIRQEGQ